MKTKNERKAQKQEKELKAIRDVAEAFLKARSVYPVDECEFREVAGKTQSDCFYLTMKCCEMKAKKIGYEFKYFYDVVTKEWLFSILPI